MHTLYIHMGSYRTAYFASTSGATRTKGEDVADSCAQALVCCCDAQALVLHFAVKHQEAVERLPQHEVREQAARVLELVFRLRLAAPLRQRPHAVATGRARHIPPANENDCGERGAVLVNALRRRIAIEIISRPSDSEAAHHRLVQSVRLAEGWTAAVRQDAMQKAEKRSNDGICIGCYRPAPVHAIE